MKYAIGPRTVAGAILLGSGALLMAYGLRVVFKANASLHWPSADGVIAVSGTAEAMGDDGFLIPFVSYTYRVGKSGFYSDRLAFPSGGAEPPKKARKIVDRYPAGKQVKVYYNPARPGEAVLEPGELSRTWDNVAEAILLLFAGRLVYRNPRKKVPGRRRKKALDDDAIHTLEVRVDFGSNLLTSCAWVLASIVLVRVFGISKMSMGNLLAGLVITAGICVEALWRRSWKTLWADLEGVLAVLAWQIVLVQCGVTNKTLDFLTFVIASVSIAWRKSAPSSEPGRATAPPGGPAPETAGAPGNLPPAPAGPPPGGYPRLKTVLRKTMFYCVSGAILFIAMMIKRRWAEDDESPLQPVYAWLAGTAFFVIVCGIYYGVKNNRCEQCGTVMPLDPGDKNGGVHCPQCGFRNQT